MSTPFHAKYFAHELSRHDDAGSVQRLTHSLFDACVDLNPHQIEAALFALRSPLSKGALLADEVGLGKTIEAGLLFCQYWAERKRRLLVICPASLRKQWSLELTEKFNLPNTVLDAKTFNDAIKQGQSNPFDTQKVVILSIHFASKHHIKLRTLPWDLVVVDEAHKLRNVYRPKNKMARNIRWALEDRYKVLLTATPLQNTLMELFGLTSLIDERVFGDRDSFRAQFIGQTGDYSELRQRINSYCKRTLRSHVSEYIRYTQRKSMTLPYNPTATEIRLYDEISEFLRRENSYSIPHAQRHLLTLILRKLLASSPYAIAGTLQIMRDRLQLVLTAEVETDLTDLNEIIEDEIIEEYSDELADELDSAGGAAKNGNNGLIAEIEELERFIRLAKSITVDTKARTLVGALDIGFAELEKIGANRKAVIFTESRRTQEYLVSFLQQQGYSGRIVTFNGINDERQSRQIYEKWATDNADTGRVTGSRAIDIRTAIIEYFRGHADILIATEAAAEGINLQFCSLVINYDLPWNPQRIEQRIGRCHRYGQKYDVVVINFLNKHNETDCRVYELLNDKLHLFNGVFGASDEVLGTIESGVDFEKRIHRIYQECRTTEETDKAFQELRSEMEEVIEHRMEETRRILLEHFDEDVHTRLKVRLDETRRQLDRFTAFFWELSKFMLADISQFHDKSLRFDLHKSPLPAVKTGTYHLISKTRDNIPGDYLYRLSHPLGEFVIAAGKAISSHSGSVYFDISNHPVKISAIERLKGKSGWLALHLLEIRSFDREQYLIFTAFTDGGKVLDQELCAQFFHCRGATAPLKEVPRDIQQKIEKHAGERVQELSARSSDLNNGYFLEECEKLDHWADDQILSAEKKLEQIKALIRETTRRMRTSIDLEGQHRLQIEIKELETQKRTLRQKLFDLEDDVLARRDELIARLEKRKTHEKQVSHLFTVRWMVI